MCVYIYIYIYMVLLGDNRATSSRVLDGPFQGVEGGRLQQPVCGAENTYLPSAKFKNAWTYTSSPIRLNGLGPD